jgi:hypothetical protein
MIAQDDHIPTVELGHLLHKAEAVQVQSDMIHE